MAILKDVELEKQLREALLNEYNKFMKERDRLNVLKS